MEREGKVEHVNNTFLALLDGTFRTPCELWLVNQHVLLLLSDAVTILNTSKDMTQMSSDIDKEPPLDVRVQGMDCASLLDAYKHNVEDAMRPVFEKVGTPLYQDTTVRRYIPRCLPLFAGVCYEGLLIERVSAALVFCK